MGNAIPLNWRVQEDSLLFANTVGLESECPIQHNCISSQLNTSGAGNAMEVLETIRHLDRKFVSNPTAALICFWQHALQRSDLLPVLLFSPASNLSAFTLHCWQQGRGLSGETSPIYDALHNTLQRENIFIVTQMTYVFNMVISERASILDQLKLGISILRTQPMRRKSDVAKPCWKGRSSELKEARHRAVAIATSVCQFPSLRGEIVWDIGK
ncbi:hypothetical protein HNY73_004945 [Argiope bruennichi]|uniref:Uncharacterized protein n=1 Tax=Argiope bruennichi TaxID=94029 RepID=A0A8T0FTC9_ARGBR|nr:hypothetical protein HNY73_004945 [Argiope bruennichi]